MHSETSKVFIFAEFASFLFATVIKNDRKAKQEKQKFRNTGNFSNIEEPLVDISVITKNVLLKCNVFRNKTVDIKKVSDSSLHLAYRN